MAETADFDCGDWAGHSFADARKAYDAHAGRSYADATTAGKTAKDVVCNVLQTDSPSPLVIVCDVTGSMGSWPATIFSKLPYLDIEGKEYLGPEMATAFMAVGDAVCGDKYPLQVQPFGQGTELADRLKALIIEGGGGGDNCESYELAALYLLRNTKTPNAVKPIVIFIGDEGIHDYVTRAMATNSGIAMQDSRLDSKAIFQELARKAATYVIRKAYGALDGQVHSQWSDYLGADHVLRLEAPDRVVDVIFGILAKETGKLDYFKGEIEGRQTPEQVATVYTSLKTIHVDVNAGADQHSGKSRMFLPTDVGAKKATKLLGK